MLKVISTILILISLLPSSLMAQNKKKNENTNYGATIEKNLEAYTLLERAQVFLESKKYQDAVLLLKVIAEKYPNALITSEDKFYIPFREKILEIISSLPLDAKELFLLEINYISLGLFKKAIEEMNESLLEEIFQKYYLSDLGDDVANQLGIISFEKGNYIKAINYFEKSLAHPQCSLNKENIKISLYYLYKSTKNEINAMTLFRQLNGNSKFKDILLQTDLAITESLKLAMTIKLEDNGFLQTNKEFWTTVWQQEYEFNFKSGYDEYGNNRGVVIRRARNNRVVNSYESENYYDEDALFNDWKKNLWYPVNNSVVTDKCVIFRKNDTLICYALENQKKILWEANIEGNNKNSNLSYPSDVQGNNKETRIPTSREEVLAFSDQIGKLMQVRNGILYVISNHEKTGAIIPFFQRRWGGNNGNVKYEGNLIFAIDIKSGKKLWKLGDNNVKGDPFYNAIFLHLPIETPYGMYLTYQSGSDIYGATISKQREVIWNKYLCSAESTSEMPTNNAVSVYGDDSIFITVDYGVIIKLNANNGNYNWVKRYNSSVESRLDFYSIPTLKNGTEVNSLIYNFGKLVVLPSDMSSILVIDSERGKEIFKIEDGFAEYRRYLLGFDDSGFYMAGSKGIRKYEYNSNQIKWQSDIKENFGKGLISGKNILFPSNRNLYIIDKNTGKKISILSIKLDKPKEPIGNLAVSNDFIVSTNYNSVSMINEVGLIITNLTENIAKNKTDELLHRRGILYYEIGEFKKSFDDISEAITLGSSNIEKNRTYCETLLDLFEKIHEAGEGKNYQAAILGMLDYFNDSNHKSLLHFLKGEINVENKKYEEALTDYITSFSQPTSLSKHRIIKNEIGLFSPAFASLKKIVFLLEHKLITEDKLIESLYISEILPEEFILLSLLEKFQSIKFKKWFFKSYLKKCNNDYVSSKIKSFLLCLVNADDPLVSLSAKYYLFLQNIQMKEYYSASVAFEFLKNQKPDALIYGQNGQELLTGKISHYQIISSNIIKELNNPSIRELTDPPLRELWSTNKKIGQQSELVKFGGISMRPEFIERSIFIHSRSENKIFGCDILTGEKKWTYEMSISKNANKFIENGGQVEFLLRMEGIALLTLDQKEYAVDLKTGKNLWSLSIDKSESLDMGSGCLLRYKSKELTVVDAFSGKKMYTLLFKDDIKKAFAYRGKLIVINMASSAFSLFNLFTGEKIKEETFDLLIRDNFYLLLEDMIIFQKSNSHVVSYSIKNGEKIWQNNFQGNMSSNNSVYNINDTKILMYCQNGLIFYLSGKDGKIIWQYEVPERFLYRSIDLSPVSGNETFLLLASSQIKQVKDISTSQDNYFVFDMVKGTLLSKTIIELSPQEFWRPRFARNVSFKGDVLPKLSVTNNNGILINFVRKRDGAMVKKHFLEIKSNNDYEMLAVKGNILLIDTRNEINFYGNPELIEIQNQKLKLLSEVFDEK